MINKSRVLRALGLSAAVAGIVIVGGSLSETKAQTRDPFAKPGWARTRESGPSGTGSRKPGATFSPGVPAIEQRIEFYKRLRAAAATNGGRIPKVTSVLTLDEMAVTGIFRTPRGYAAMVEATPIKLSYTIYPGEKFFDGQLVAVEENRLVFRKVTKLGERKFVSSVENKPLQKYTDQQVVQGTAPSQPGEQVAQQPAPAQVNPTAEGGKTAPVVIVSPIDEMNRQTPPERVKAKKESKKPVKVARNK